MRFVYLLSVLLLSTVLCAQQLTPVADTLMVENEKGVVYGEVKWGYQDEGGNWKVPPVYDYAGPFSEGMAPVGIFDKVDGWKYGYINEQGILVINLMYDAIGRFSEGLAYVAILNISWVDKPEEKKYHKIGYIDKTNNMVITLPAEFSKPSGNCYYKGEMYSGGFARLKKSEASCSGMPPLVIDRSSTVQIVKEQN
ncbi:MAG: WG repeat-containing protein [Chitinophagales bacterium]|nr:WG repeat-containing protein [Chitinophagales bacterium]